MEYDRTITMREGRTLAAAFYVNTENNRLEGEGGRGREKEKRGDRLRSKDSLKINKKYR